MTVKELMEILAQYNEDEKITLVGGENSDGEFAELLVNDEIIMTDED